MNGKQAKRLRRAAIGLAATFDEAGRKISKDEQMTTDGTILNRPDSVKGIYRTIKKGVVSGKVGKP
jgi:hypothetical protein